MNITSSKYSHPLSRNDRKQTIQAGFRGVARRLILAMILFSALITLIVTAIQLYRDYNRDLQMIDSQFKQIQDVHIRSIAGSLWLLDEQSMQILVDGISQLPDISYLEVSDGENIRVSAGNKQTEKMIFREYPLTYQHLGKEQKIGSMTVVATLKRIYQRLIDKTVDILVSNAVRTFLVAGFTLLMFHFLVTRHLIEIAGFVHRQDMDKEGELLRLDRKPSNSRADELDLVVKELNLMRNSLQQTFATLKQSEAKYRELYDTMAQGVVQQDAKGKIVSANHAACDILGLSLDQMQGKTSLDPGWKTIYEDGREFPGTEHPAIKALHSGKSVDDVVMGVYHPKEQRYRWIIVSSKPRFLPGESKAYEVFSTFTDISERKRASQEREALIAELENKNSELERFVYTISHELKAPLVTISGFSGILANDIEKNDKENLIRHLQHITLATATMSTLLDELLELSRIGRIINTPESVSMLELVDGVIKMVELQAAERKIKIEVSPELPDAFGDRNRLREVLQNLTENAIKFSSDRPDAKIKIGCRDEENSDPIYYVQDNGRGIDPAYHDRVFELFERLDPQIEGTGVGLALVKRIIEKHGGKTWVESEGAGTGSTFCFTVPQREHGA